MKRTKLILTVCLMLVLLTFVTGCGQEIDPYTQNDEQGYRVSVKFDANGGTFTTNTSVIVDSYNAAQLQADSDGKVRIPLLSPDDPLRRNDAFTAIRNGYFLAGWYENRTEQTDSDGNTVYAYSGKWDFASSRMTVDPSEAHTASEPVLTLYAAWIPMFEVEFYDLGTGEYLDTHTFNPVSDGALLVPVLNEQTGAMEMYDFPERPGYTYNGAYYDPEGTTPVDTEAVLHTGTVDEATGTADGYSMKLYVDWTEGEWFHIYNVEQFLDNASVSGNYILHADLDFTDENWPTSLMHGNFSGRIQGNGHTLRNIQLVQTNNSKVNSGLFGSLTETAQLSGLTLENVTFTIQAGTRVAGASFGLLAGSISDEAVFEDVTIRNGMVQIDSGCYFGVDDYCVGLLCGMGNAAAVDASGIRCQATGENPDSLIVTADGNEVTVEFVVE